MLSSYESHMNSLQSPTLRLHGSNAPPHSGRAPPYNVGMKIMSFCVSFVMLCTMQPAGTMTPSNGKAAIFADAARGTASAIIDCPPPLYWLCGK